MFQKRRSPRRSDLLPSLNPLEKLALLNGAPVHPMHHLRVPAQVADAKHHEDHLSQGNGPPITILYNVLSNGYHFTNADGPTPGTNAGAGTNMNGISNVGTSVGLTISNDRTVHNFAVNPRKTRTAESLKINGSTTAMAFGINSAGTVVGTDGNGHAFTLSRRGKLVAFIPQSGSSAVAFGINDQGAVGLY
jgi:hypothetical protein